MITIEGQLYSTKNSRRILRAGNGRRFVAKSARSAKAQQDLILQLNTWKGEWRKMTKGIDKPLRVRFWIYRKTRARFDYCNIVQGVLDAMTASGLITDDNADEVLPVFTRYEVDAHRPRLMIDICEDTL